MHRLQQGSKVVGTKQTMKALQLNMVSELYVAEDAKEAQIEPLIHLAEKELIPIVYMPSMTELGKACDVEVRTATAALIVNDGEL